MTNYEKHLNCQAAIRYKKFNDRNDLTPELYCIEHNKHIKWLSQDDADYLTEQGIPNSGMK